MNKISSQKMEMIFGGQNGGKFVACAAQGLVLGFTLPAIGGIIALVYTAGCYYRARS